MVLELPRGGRSGVGFSEGPDAMDTETEITLPYNRELILFLVIGYDRDSGDPPRFASL